jgi:hypothetical protein
VGRRHSMTSCQTYTSPFRTRVRLRLCVKGLARKS